LFVFGDFVVKSMFFVLFLVLVLLVMFLFVIYMGNICECFMGYVGFFGVMSVLFCFGMVVACFVVVVVLVILVVSFVLLFSGVVSS